MTPVATYAYEDFPVGQEFPLGPQSISAEQIVAFASEFDPQPMHLSEEAGRQSILGGLVAHLQPADADDGGQLHFELDLGGQPGHRFR